MITRILVLAAATVVTAAALTGCVRASGPMTSEVRDISAVTAVTLDTDGDVRITEGAPSLTIHAPQDLLPVLTSEVNGGVLELGRRPGGITFGSAEIRYDLTVESLDAITVNGSGDITSTLSGDAFVLSINGSGDVTIEGLAASTVEVTIDGSGDVDLDGTAGSLAVAIGGSGEVDADDLEVVDATVEIGGSGDAALHVTGTLSVDISGSGSVTHRGGAEVESEVSGSGSVDDDGDEDDD